MLQDKYSFSRNVIARYVRILSNGYRHTSKNKITFLVLTTILAVSLSIAIWTQSLSASFNLLFSESQRLETINEGAAKGPFEFTIVTDLDTDARVLKSSLFKAYTLTGNIHIKTEDVIDTTDTSQLHVPNTNVVTNYTVHFNNSLVEVLSKYNEGGRGMELSDLIYFNGDLLAFDDRSGIVYKLHNGKALPRHVLLEGDGASVDKGMKIEWATVKDDVLWIGSTGKEFTTPTGSILLHKNAYWVVSITKQGVVQYQNWEHIYNKMRSKLNIDYPGYMIHEAINWSPYLKKWVVLPRRVSHSSYDEIRDEKMGSNIMLICNETFNHIDVVYVGTLRNERGYSSFKFMPFTKDTIIVALKSEEDAARNHQRSYITIFGIDGTVYLDDLPVPHDLKFEGIEFLVNK